MIKISNLSKIYGDFKVLNGINLNVDEGEIFGIIGRSGSGKSTLLRCINGLTDFDTGEITVDDTDLSALSTDELLNFRKNIGMIFQSFSLVSRLTAYENIALPLKIRDENKKDIKDQVYEISKVIGIEDKLDSKPNMLSGGQKQRVAIARALITNPKIILSDESTSALDPETTNSILRLFRKINRELKVTIVLVSHEINLIAENCDRLIILEDGNIIDQGTPENTLLLNSEKSEHLLSRGDFAVKNDNTCSIELFLRSPEEDIKLQSLFNEIDFETKIPWSQNYNFKNSDINMYGITVKKKNFDEMIKVLEKHQVSWRLN